MLSCQRAGSPQHHNSEKKFTIRRGGSEGVHAATILNLSGPDAHCPVVSFYFSSMNFFMGVFVDRCEKLKRSISEHFSTSELHLLRL